MVMIVANLPLSPQSNPSEQYKRYRWWWWCWWSIDWLILSFLSQLGHWLYWLMTCSECSMCNLCMAYTYISLTNTLTSHKQIVISWALFHIPLFNMLVVLIWLLQQPTKLGLWSFTNWSKLNPDEQLTTTNNDGTKLIFVTGATTSEVSDLIKHLLSSPWNIKDLIPIKLHSFWYHNLQKI